MRQLLVRVAAASLLATAVSVDAIDSNIPPAGLPSASSYSATLLPEMDGVLSWKTLGEVEPVKRDGQVVPQFSSKILGLDGK